MTTPDEINACALPPDADRIARAQIDSLLDAMGFPSLEQPVPEWRHECYAMALRFFAYPRLPEVPEGGTRRVSLVHGFPRIQDGHPEAGTLYGHAWVEFTDTTPVPETLQRLAGWPPIVAHTHCWDASTGAVWPLPLYYAIGQIDPDHCARWEDPIEVFDLIKARNHIGNWAPEDDLPERPRYNDDQEVTT